MVRQGGFGLPSNVGCLVEESSKSTQLFGPANVRLLSICRKGREGAIAYDAYTLLEERNTCWGKRIINERTKTNSLLHDVWHPCKTKPPFQAAWHRSAFWQTRTRSNSPVPSKQQNAMDRKKHSPKRRSGSLTPLHALTPPPPLPDALPSRRLRLITESNIVNGSNSHATVDLTWWKMPKTETPDKSAQIISKPVCVERTSVIDYLRTTCALTVSTFHPYTVNIRV